MKKDAAPALSDADIQKLLKAIGQAFKAAREEKKTLDDLAYEINLSRSALARLEAGGDPRLSTLLKVMHGLKLKQVDFFKDFK